MLIAHSACDLCGAGAGLLDSDRRWIFILQDNCSTILQTSRCDIAVPKRVLPITGTGNASRNNVPNKRLLSGTFLCAVLGTLRSRFCVPDTV
jgi:hypothetical protein